MEWLLEEYGPDGFIPIMVMYDTTPATALEYATEKNITFPILSDSSMEVFARWDPTGEVPSTTMIDRGAVVDEVGTNWYQAMIEELVYDE